MTALVEDWKGGRVEGCDEETWRWDRTIGRRIVRGLHRRVKLGEKRRREEDNTRERESVCVWKKMTNKKAKNDERHSVAVTGQDRTGTDRKVGVEIGSEEASRLLESWPSGKGRRERAPTRFGGEGAARYW